MKRLLLPLLILLLVSQVQAQEDPLNISIAPPAPNAFAFARYVDIPPSTYTGVPSISIPLGSLSEKGASVDLSLSYHASGIKVDEIASWVGLGWSLNAGGIITRTERDQAERPDGSGGIAPTRLDLGFPDVDSQGKFSTSDFNIFHDAEGILYDVEPDIFYYNFGGRSGKFVFDANGDAQFYKYEDLKVEFVKSYTGLSNPMNAKFIITDEHGIEYEFDRIDKTWSAKIGQTVPTSWYLTKISSPKGGEITLEYDSVKYVRPFHYQDPSLLIDLGAPQSIWRSPKGYWFGGTELFLKRISTSSGGYIEFKTGAEKRKDYYYGNLYPLEEISFFDLNDQPIKHVKFNTSYFVSEPITFSGYSSQHEHLRYRLKLDAVRFFSRDKTSSDPPYKFEYYSDLNPTLYNLPFRLSPEQDHWGYYNASGDIYMFPEITWTVSVGKWFEEMMGIPEDYSTSNFSGGGSRDPDATAAKACALYKVYYPTGGSRVYDMESHVSTFGVGGGLRVKSIINYDQNDVVTNQRRFIYKLTKDTIGGSTSGRLIIDPRDYYVILGKANRINVSSPYEVPIGALGGILGSAGEWSQLSYNNSGYVAQISSIPQTVLGATQGQAIGYQRVFEVDYGNGYSEYNYTTSSSYPDAWNAYQDPDAPLDMFKTQYSTAYPTQDGPFPLLDWNFGYRTVYSDVVCNQFPFLDVYSADWKRGHLFSVKRYNESDQLVSEKVNEYFKPNLTHVAGYKVYNVGPPLFNYLHGKYYIPANWVALKKVTETQYDLSGGNPVTTIKEIEYNSDSNRFPKLEKTWDSKGELTEKKYYYPHDYNTSISDINALVNNTHVIGKPVKTEVIKDGNLVDGTVIKYKGWGDPYEVLKYENTDLVPPQAHSETIYEPTNYEGKIKYEYYPVNQVTEVRPDNGKPTAYFWGINNDYPIVQAVGVDDLTLKNAISTAMGSISGYQTLENLILATIRKMGDGVGNLRSTWDDFNGYLRNVSSLSDAHVTTYTFDPDIGLTSKTDPAGITTYYEYDTRNRLFQIEDHNGKIVKRYDYNYKENLDYHLFPSTLSFGSIPTGGASDLVLKITNTGTATASIDGVTYPDRFSGEEGSFSVSPGNTHDLTVSFEPTVIQSYSGNITLTSASAGNQTVQVSGTGVTPTRIINIQDLSGNNIPPNTYYMYENIDSGDETDVTLQIHNSGNTAFNITGHSFNGDQSNFRTNLLPTTVDPGETIQFDVFFYGTGSGTKTSDLNINTNPAIISGSSEVTISGEFN